jgi:hypothetical protein
MTSNHVSTGWRFWGACGLAFLGFPLGGLASIGLVGGVESVLDGAIGGAACGATLGAVQWLVLRRRLSLPRSWIVATSLGMASGLALTLALFGTSTTGSVLLLRGVTTGVLIGLAQWVVLRGSVPRAWGLGADGRGRLGARLGRESRYRPRSDTQLCGVWGKWRVSVPGADRPGVGMAAQPARHNARAN